MKNLDKSSTECLGLIPVLTTQAGRCLTTENWQDAGVQVVSLHLAELLMKPGYDFLSTLKSLATYVGWPSTLVLNATLPSANAAGRYSIRSQYDGRRIEHSVQEMIAIIATLQPTTLVLPQGVWKNFSELCQLLPESIFTFIPIADLPVSTESIRSYGVYVAYDQQTMSPESLLQQLSQYKGLPYYVAGALNLPLMRELSEYGVQCLETDTPAADACRGMVYCSEGELSLSDVLYAKQFSAIDEACHCLVCSQGFTRAYLHHLFQHTPLLCQRLLVQHNVFYCRTSFTSE